jgi:uncharacterized membrane protein
VVLIRALAAAICLLAAVGGIADSPVRAHENHMAERATVVEQANEAGTTDGAVDARSGADGAEAGADERPVTLAGRAMRWLGKIHPFAVHFPIALFPVSLVALFLARRRGETSDPIRALIIVAGVSIVIAALLGWQAAGYTLADRDPVQTWHRWIGTGVAVAGAGLALAAWRRRQFAHGAAMVAALALVTFALLVQGWLGAIIVHGIEHMRF